MKALVVVANPCDDSFTHAAAAAAVRGLETAHHEARLVDLYADGFAAAMSRQERIDYHDPGGPSDPLAADYAEAVRGSEMVVFVYPTWWSGQPAIMKGFLDRVLVPEVAFTIDPTTNRVKSRLGYVKQLVGISTYGSPWWYVKFVNDNGRRVIMRSLRSLTSLRTRTEWLALYSMDTTTETDRTEFLDRIERRLARL